MVVKKQIKELKKPILKKNIINKITVKKIKTNIKKEPKKLILTGPPGGGKGTIAELVEKKLKIPHIAMGDILRSHVERKTKIGKEIAQIMKNGNLISNQITNELIQKKLNEKETKNKFCLDGFPRNIEQAKFLLSKFKIDEILVVKISDKKIIDRLKLRIVCPSCGASYHLKNKVPKKKGICDRCGSKLIRRDDEDKIKHRLQVYKKETQPIIKYYKKEKIKIKYLPGDFDFKTEKDLIISLINK